MVRPNPRAGKVSEMDCSVSVVNKRHSSKRWETSSMTGMLHTGGLHTQRPSRAVLLMIHGHWIMGLLFASVTLMSRIHAQETHSQLQTQQSSSSVTDRSDKGICYQELVTCINSPEARTYRGELLAAALDGGFTALALEVRDSESDSVIRQHLEVLSKLP